MKVAILIRMRPDGQYIAHCPSLPGCVAKGQTRESAERGMRDAVAGYLASLDVPLPPKMVITEAQGPSR